MPHTTCLVLAELVLTVVPLCSLQTCRMTSHPSSCTSCSPSTGAQLVAHAKLQGCLLPQLPAGFGLCLHKFSPACCPPHTTCCTAISPASCICVHASWTAANQANWCICLRRRIDYVLHGDDPCLLPDGTDAYAHAKKLGRFKMVGGCGSCCVTLLPVHLQICYAMQGCCHRWQGACMCSSAGMLTNSGSISLLLSITARCRSSGQRA